MKETETECVEIPEVEVQLVKSSTIHGTQVLRNSDKVFELFQKRADLMDRECVYMLCLRTDTSMINYSIVSIGSHGCAVIEPCEILRVAILSCASGIILVHTHPSGNIRPSKEDVKVTDRLSRACAICGIRLVDHLILGRGNPEHYSFQRHDNISGSDICLEVDAEKLNIRKVAEEESMFY